MDIVMLFGFLNSKFVSTVTNDYKGFIDTITNVNKKMLISSFFNEIILAEI